MEISNIFHYPAPYTKSCLIEVDVSYFANRPYYVSASWFVVTDQTIVGVGVFITSTTVDYLSAHAAEMYRFLPSLQRINKLFANNEDTT